MAVVAFPFSTCFTSEEFDDDHDMQQPYGSTSDMKEPSILDNGSIGEDVALAGSSEPLSPGETTNPTSSSDGEICYDMLDSDVALLDSIDASINDNHAGDSNTPEVAMEEDTEENIVDTAMETIPTQMHVGETITTFENYGGLSNLGNSCYMASALQMVASLDRFTQELEENAPVSPHGGEEQEQQSCLRKQFLDLMTSLQKGQTIRPSEFKQALDERTPLFIGYSQEDSHEFLTTLFDLLDADYRANKEEKKTDENEEEEGQTKSVSDMEEEEDDSQDNNGATVENEADEDEHLQATQRPGDDSCTQELVSDDMENGTPATTSETINKDLQAEEQRQSEYESATKRLRYLEVDDRANDTIQATTSTGLNSVQSFSDLQPDGIEALLHDRPLVNSTSGAATTPSPLRCKLAGGRMASSEANGRVLFCGSDDASMSAATSSREVPQQEENDDDSSDTPAVISPVESYLQTEVRVRLTCESCKYTRTHLENFLHLSLEIGADSNESVPASAADGLRKFFAPEKREIKCEKCFCETALQTMEITKLPRALLLHFKRFIVDVSDDYTSISYRKNQSEVLFDESLEVDGVLSELVADDYSLPKGYICPPAVDDQEGVASTPAYNIRSVVNHIGSSAACGHYTADALRSYPGEEERRWTRFNDSVVSDISSVEAVSESYRTAYMVMYEIS